VVPELSSLDEVVVDGFGGLFPPEPHEVPRSATTAVPTTHPVPDRLPYLRDASNRHQPFSGFLLLWVQAVGIKGEAGGRSCRAMSEERCRGLAAEGGAPVIQSSLSMR
jgi:hypothetical protein